MDKVTKDNALVVEELTDLTNKYLTPKALEDLSRKSYTATTSINGSTVAKAIFLGVSVGTGNIEKGVQKLSATINELSEQGLIHSVLGPVTSIDFSRVPGKAPTSVVVFYPLVPIDKADEIMAKYKSMTMTEKTF